MTYRAVVTLQSGLWIDSRQLIEAGLQESLEITIQPGEITIRSAASQGEGTAENNTEVENGYPLVDESFREGWQAAGMDDYDRYEELRKE